MTDGMKALILTLLALTTLVGCTTVPQMTKAQKDRDSFYKEMLMDDSTSTASAADKLEDEIESEIR